ncbi:hypothetical protein PCANC_17299 [Puccinia coronata f. sp. avenae]|uniref:Reverse transcriptase Ty1/copia-type domain-containing protein n=1 Tax=Puccinia coronata f. sp. avenae TaxID=200324 RepID=A0A2N5UIE0_9BASI|nr:hypothetical protein PCANC_17299 [Puccinia coronata f. sp. avenae]
MQRAASACLYEAACSGCTPFFLGVQIGVRTPPLSSPLSVSILDPKRFKETAQSPVKTMWIDACQKEITNMKDKDVYKLATKPPDKRLIKGRWVFKIKMKTNGEIAKYKARFVAKGYTQIGGEDYGDAFSPTGKPTSLRIIIAMAAIFKWQIEQMDAVAAFLNN